MQQQQHQQQLIAKKFEEFRRAAIPGAASEIQVHDMRISFFSGAGGLFSLLMTLLDAGTDATDQDMELMRSIQGELLQFSADIKNMHRSQFQQEQHPTHVSSVIKCPHCGHHSITFAQPSVVAS